MTGFTTTEIELAIKNLEATNQKVSTINMRKILGRGSYGTLQKILRQKGYLEEPVKSSETGESDVSGLGYATDRPDTDHKNQPVTEANENYQSLGSSGIESMIHDAEKTLNQLRSENLKLSNDIQHIENNITTPLTEYQAVLKFFNNRLFQGSCPEIPKDLLIVLRELILRSRQHLGILHNDKSEFYRDEADKLLKAIFLSQNI